MDVNYIVDEENQKFEYGIRLNKLFKIRKDN